MNGLKHIILLLGIGIFSSVLFSQDCDNGMVYMENFLNSDSLCVPTTFSTANQSMLQAAYFFTNVTIDEYPVDADDWVGAFNGDICVGASQWDTSLCGGGICSINVMGDDGTEDTPGYCNNQ